MFGLQQPSAKLNAETVSLKYGTYNNSFPSGMDPEGGTDLRFFSLEPNIT